MNEHVIRRRLIEQRDRLISLRDSLSIDASLDQPQSDAVGDVSSPDQNIADAGTETFEREKDLSILSGVEAELADVEWALRRVAEGSYGRCAACGRPIGTARLQARPATRFCLDDQSRREREVRTA
jgi:RNA polymerase-binding transcription factor DksA